MSSLKDLGDVKDDGQCELAHNIPVTEFTPVTDLFTWTTTNNTPVIFLYT